MNEPVTIPDEAVEAAGKAAWLDVDPEFEPEWESLTNPSRAEWLRMARAALEAAAPALREQFLTAAGLERTPVGTTPDGVVIDEWRPGPALLAAERERIATLIDANRRGVTHPENAYNEAFAHGLVCAARWVRETS